MRMATTHPISEHMTIAVLTKLKLNKYPYIIDTASSHPVHTDIGACIYVIWPGASFINSDYLNQHRH